MMFKDLIPRIKFETFLKSFHMDDREILSNSASPVPIAGPSLQEPTSSLQETTRLVGTTDVLTTAATRTPVASNPEGLMSKELSGTKD